MEHRHSTVRHQCDIKVPIYRQGNPIAFGRIKNCCSQGLLVETDFKDVYVTQQLKLEVMSGKKQGRGNINNIFIDALIMHVTKNGFGTEIDIPIPEQAELFFSSFKGEPVTPKNRDDRAVGAGH